MNKVWFDASFNSTKKLAKIGIYIESVEQNIIYRKTLEKKGLSGSTQAEMYALLKAIETVKELKLEEMTVFYGDSMSVIQHLKMESLPHHFIYKHCYALVKELKIEKKQFQWIERRYNKADYLTRKEPKKEIVIWMTGDKEVKRGFHHQSSTYILLDEAYHQYKNEVKGNGNVSYYEAERKLNRNIKRANNKSILLINGMNVFIYFNLLIYTERNRIVHLYNVREDGKGYTYFNERKEELEDFLKKQKTTVSVS